MRRHCATASRADERERESERGWGREGGSLSPNGLVFMKLDNLTFARIETGCFSLQVLSHLNV